MNDLIWALLGLCEDDGRILTCRMDATALIRVTTGASKRHLSDEVFGKVFEALDLAEFRRGDRNFVLHGVWGTLMPDNKPIAQSIRPEAPEGTLIAETFVKERMNEIIDDILQAKNGLVKVHSELLASRRKPEPPRPVG